MLQVLLSVWYLRYGELFSVAEQRAKASEKAAVHEKYADEVLHSAHRLEDDRGLCSL